MLRSLVGSEMCIRDSPRAPVAAVNVNYREGEGALPYDESHSFIMR